MKKILFILTIFMFFVFSLNVKAEDIFVKDWTNMTKEYSFTDDFIMMAKTSATYQDGYILADVDIEEFFTKGAATTDLAMYNLKGEVITSTEVNEGAIVELATHEENIYALVWKGEKENSSSPNISIIKYDSSLNKQKEIVIEEAASYELFNAFTMISKMYNMKSFKTYNDKIYYYYGIMMFEFDLDLNILRREHSEYDTTESDEILQDFILLFNNNVYSFASKENREIITGEVTDENTSEIYATITLKENNVVVFEKTLDNYKRLISTKFIDDYIVTIASTKEKDFPEEILVLDLEGNIIQIITSETNKMSLSISPDINDKGFIISTFDMVEVCPDDSTTTCTTSNFEYYYIPYKVEQDLSGEGTIEIIEQVKAGEKVTFVVTPKDGYKLSQIQVLDSEGNEVEIENNTFIMPYSDITIKAYFVVENPNTITFLKLGLIAVIIFAIYNLFISRKIKIKRFA